MNYVDWIIVGTLLIFGLEALGRSFLYELLDLVSFILAGFLSYRLYNFPAGFLETQYKIPHGLSLVLGFIAVWFLSEIVFMLIVKFSHPFFPKIKLPVTRLFSIIPAVARAFIVIAIGLVMLSTFPIQPAVKKAALDSKIGSQILKNAYKLETPIKQVFGGVTTDTLTFLTIRPRTDERVDLGFQTSEITIDVESEVTMVNLVNSERTKRGFKLLKFDAGLRAVSRSHSSDMMRRGYFAHYSPEGDTSAERASKAGIDFLVLGENLAYAPDVEFAHRGLMDSEGHRANILSPDYGRIGIGVYDGGVYGKMFTQVFAD